MAYLCEQLDLWMPRTFGAALSSVAAQTPTAEAVIAGADRLTYDQLYQGARRAAAGLRALGIKHGDHVALCFENSCDWVTLFYGCALVGAVVVPVNTRFKESELRYCVGQSDPRR